MIFDQIDIINKSLQFLIRYADRLDIVIVENPSDNTPKITKIVDDFGYKGLIKRYYLFDQNITNNAYDVVVNKELKNIKKSPYVIITDGDLTSKNEDWLNEELEILRHNPDVFACGISLDKSNLPIATFPEAKDWIPPDKREETMFFETYTGLHLVLIRGRELHNFINWKDSNGLHFVDGVMHRYCYEVLHKKWCRTKNSVAYHLTWDLYMDRKHPYTKMKLQKSFQDTWYHQRKASYRLKEY
ncbi:MAG TPA: hypothetical protein VLE74_00645 [Candidatus Saccharimonadales bacterium]|nr:hypothetical protein [Candidatus Saccharimonadales bacterium]